ncbi:hypothetical protein HPB51_004037 [Rhipicephalus microplus]|uniref:Uncharacterized protein n=1 Tax=Rhipicephalus microplus TaxID=6941 RepID=A0A9J6EXP9_RHIMP|nr:hypothetical protein HPB51_004037 [Rhipicephalus microplus]
MTSSTLVETVSLNYEDFSENFLTCSTCLCTYDGQERSPKLLSCSHTVCRSCLERLAAAARSQGTLRCPICREAVPLPEPGVGALPPSFLVNQLLDLVASRRREVVPKCALHPAGPELLFCEACDQVFCSMCLGPAHADSSHTVVPFSIAVKRMSEILLYKSQLCLSKLDAAAEAVSAEITRLDAAAEEVTDQIEASFREIQDLLEQRRKSLLATLQKIADLDVKMGSLDHLAEPRENCYLHFDCAYNSALDDIAQALRVFGKLETSRTFPPLCTISVKDCPAYVKARALLRTYDCDGRPQTVGGDPVTVALVACNEDQKQLDVQVIDRGTGEYTVAFQVPHVARYRLAVSVLGRPLQGSPFEFAATDNIDPEAVFGRHGDGTDGFHQPVAVVYGPEGLLYVLDTGNCRIKVLTPELRFVRHLTEVGTEERGGTGLAISPSAGTLVTCNWRTRTVTEFTAEGTIVRTFTHVDLLEPTALTVDSQGYVFVVDSGKRCIFIFNQEGTLVKKVEGKVLALPTNFNPSAIAMSADNNVLVADSTIHVLDSQGNRLSTMFAEGKGKGRFGGICVDAQGIVLATRSDRSKNNVLLFDRVGGQLTYTIESRSSRLGRPLGIAYTPRWPRCRGGPRQRLHQEVSVQVMRVHCSASCPVLQICVI